MNLMYARSHYLMYGQKPLAATNLGQTGGMPQGLESIVFAPSYHTMVGIKKIAFA